MAKYQLTRSKTVCYQLIVEAKNEDEANELANSESWDETDSWENDDTEITEI